MEDVEVIDSSPYSPHRSTPQRSQHYEIDAADGANDSNANQI